VLRNRLAIIERLGIELDDVVYDNPYVQRKTRGHGGCQIDYMIQTRHRTLYVCEIKFSHGAVPSSVIEEIEHKVDCLEMPRRMTWRPVLIHVGEVVRAVTDAGVATVDCGDLLR
jgi:uncharacterized protein